MSSTEANRDVKNDTESKKAPELVPYVITCRAASPGLCRPLDRAGSGMDDPGMFPGEPPALRLRGTERRIADALRRLGPATRADVGAATRLSRATVSAGLSALLEAGLAVETSGAAPVGPAGGRPPGLVRLAPAAGLAVGVDVGRTHLRVAVADLGHHVLGEQSVRLERGTPAGEVLDGAADLVGT